jgi:hypothetical protein
MSNRNITVTEVFDTFNQAWIWCVRFTREDGVRRSAPFFTSADAHAFAKKVCTGEAK